MVLIALLIIGFCTKYAVGYHSMGSGWAAETPVAIPQLSALIGQPNDIDQSHRAGKRKSDVFAYTFPISETSLVVQNGSFLILTCSASYPVQWWKNDANEELVIEQRNDMHEYPSFFLRNQISAKQNRNQSGTDSTVILPETSVSFIVFNMVNPNSANTYKCKSLHFEENPVSSTLRLFVTNTSNFDLNEAKILQGGFKSFTPFWAFRTEYIILVYIPLSITNHNVKQILILPDNTEVEPGDKPHNGVSIKNVNVSTIFLQCVIVFDGIRNEYSGEYQLILETTTINGTSRMDNYSFVAGVANVTTFATVATEQDASDKFRTYLVTGRPYSAAFLVSKSQAVILNSSVQVFAQSSYDKNCSLTKLPSSKILQECGIFGVHSGSRPDGIHIISVKMRAIRSCMVQAQVLFNDTDEGLYTETSFLRIIAVDGNLFPIIGADKLVIQPLDNTTKSGDDLLTNENFTIRCIFPMCAADFTAWGKEDSHSRQRIMSDWNSHQDVSSVGSINEDPRITTTPFRLNNNTLAVDLNFRSLDTRHTGRYRCAYERVMHTHANNDAYFDIVVKDPVLPAIKHGGQASIEKRWLAKDGTLTLQCDAYGHPKVVVSWSRVDENGHEEIMQGVTDFTLQVTRQGEYTCKVKNKFGEDWRKFNVRPYDGTLLTWLLITGCVVVTAPAGTAISIWWRRRNAKLKLLKRVLGLFASLPDDLTTDIDKPLNDQTENLPYTPANEIDRDRFTLEKEIGSGQFGKVFKGVLKASGDDEVGYPVAIKLPRDPKDYQQYVDLVGEYKIMARIPPHVNVVSLVGICKFVAEQRLFLHVLTEFCEYGSLETYLEKHWRVFQGFGDKSLPQDESSSTLLGYAYQAAKGMRHLAAQNIIHRDLALRNLLLTKKQIVKISDFGMSRQHIDAYKKALSPNVAVPFRWMAPESLSSGQYTQKSDVWSLGVVLWELFTCQVPYCKEDLCSIPELLTWLQQGRRLQKPDIASQEMYDLMLDCWNKDRECRPTFSECKRRIGQHLEKTSPTMYGFIKDELSKQWPKSAYEIESSDKNNTAAAAVNADTSSSSSEESEMAVEMPTVLSIHMDDSISGAPPQFAYAPGEAESHDMVDGSTEGQQGDVDGSTLDP